MSEMSKISSVTGTSDILDMSNMSNVPGITSYSTSDYQNTISLLSMYQNELVEHNTILQTIRFQD